MIPKVIIVLGLVKFPKVSNNNTTEIRQESINILILNLFLKLAQLTSNEKILSYETCLNVLRIDICNGSKVPDL